MSTGHIEYTAGAPNKPSAQSSIPESEEEILRRYAEKLRAHEEFRLGELLDEIAQIAHKAPPCKRVLEDPIAVKVLQTVADLDVGFWTPVKLKISDFLGELPPFEYQGSPREIINMLNELYLRGKMNEISQDEYKGVRGSVAKCLSHIFGSLLQLTLADGYGPEGLILRIEVKPYQALLNYKIELGGKRDKVVYKVVSNICFKREFRGVSACIQDHAIVLNKEYGTYTHQFLGEDLFLNAQIVEAKRVRLKGLLQNPDIVEVFKIKVRSAIDAGSYGPYIGTVADLASELVRFGFQVRGKQTQYLHALLRALTQGFEYEELFYSPGPWVVDGRIEIAEEAGYRPKWKESVKYWTLVKPKPEEGIDPKLGLEIIKRTIEAYGDPQTVSAAFSHITIGWAAHWFKQLIGYFPGGILEGREGAGKSYLLEFVKLLFNMDWNDAEPASDYQARRELAKSTLPYILTEGNSFFKKLINRDSRAMSGFQVVLDNTTQLVLRVSGGKPYGGLYLGIRPFFAATNIEIQETPWEADKLLTYTFTKEARINLDAVRGITPAEIRSHPKLKQSLASVFTLYLKRFEEMIPEIEERLRGGGRGHLANEYIRISYEIWKELFTMYGLEPFPEPAEAKLTGKIETIEDRYKSALITYIALHMQGDRTVGIDPESPFVVVNDIEAARTAIRRYDAVIYNGELLLRPTFLDKFKKWAKKVYGLEPLSQSRLIEIFGLKETTRSQLIKGKLYRYKFTVESSEEADKLDLSDLF